MTVTTPPRRPSPTLDGYAAVNAAEDDRTVMTTTGVMVEEPEEGVHVEEEDMERNLKGSHTVASGKPTKKRRLTMESLGLIDTRIPEGVAVSEEMDVMQCTRDTSWRFESLLLRQCSGPLIFAAGGSILSGWVLSTVSHWKVFLEVTQLFILIPAVLGLKGNLEMNLASRLATAANLGFLDRRRIRSPLIRGNLALLQLQSFVVGTAAGCLSLFLSWMGRYKSIKKHYVSFGDHLLVVSLAGSAASASSIILGTFMAALCLVCRWIHVNPDNVLTPVASSFGDLIMLVVFSGLARIVHPFSETLLPILLTAYVIFAVPYWWVVVKRNEHVRKIVGSGWSPLVISMFISSLAGMLLERYVIQYPALPMLTPVLNGVVSNLSGIFTSRISTALHAQQDHLEPSLRVGQVLLFINLPVQWAFLVFVEVAGLGQVPKSLWFLALYTMVALTHAMLILVCSRFITKKLFRMGYDPDNYALPYVGALTDVIGTSLLVSMFMVLEYIPGAIQV